MSTFSHCRGKAFLGKPATITFGENKDQSWIKFRLLYDKSFAPALGGACAMGNQHHGIDPNVSNSGHHDCSSQQQHQHVQPSPPFIQHSLSNSFRCSILFFLGLALGASCVASTTTEKHWFPVSTFSHCRGKAFLGKPATITFGENKDQSWIKFRLLYDKSFAPALGGACAMGNQHHGIDPNVLSSGHHDCSSQQQHQHVQPSPPFIQHSLSNSFRCSFLFFLGLALGASCIASTTTEKHGCPVSTFSYCRGKAFLGKPATITFRENKYVNSWIKFRI